jgi:hypothetical protein
MRQAKAQGQITRFPGGRRARGLPKLSRDPKIRRAQRIIEAVMAETEKSTAVVPKVWEEMSRAEKLAANAEKALSRTSEILDIAADTENPKVLGIIANVALSVIGYQIRVEAGLPPPRIPDPVIEGESLAERADREIRESFAEWKSPAIERPSVDAKPVLSDPPRQPEPAVSPGLVREFAC